jgi:FkbM family methyltransferase
MTKDTPQVLSVMEVIRYIHSCAADSRTSGFAIDVGAHIGQFSKELIDSGLFAGVIAFEPNPANGEALAQLASRERRITVVRCAVGALEGKCDFHCDDNTSTGSLLHYRQDYLTDGAVRKLSVPVVTLDDYCASTILAGERIGLIKIDTQGHDLAVIRGASRTLKSNRPIVIAELIYVPMYSGQALPDEIFGQMRENGYQLYSLFNIHATIEGRIAYADAIFVPDELDVPQSQKYVQIDNHVSLQTQIRILEGICRERLSVINALDAKVKRLASKTRAWF